MGQQVGSLTMTAGRWPASLTALVTQAVSWLAGAEVDERLVLVLEGAAADPAQDLAARAALRSLVHASTLERPDLSVNLVLGGSPEDREKTLAFLAGPDGGFVRGATLDLGSAG